MAETPDPWSWKKLFSGFFSGKNTAKALVLLFHIGLILTLCFGLYLTYRFAKSKYIKPLPTQTVGTNQGTITTNNIDETKKSWSLIESLVKFGNTNNSDK